MIGPLAIAVALTSAAPLTEELRDETSAPGPQQARLSLTAGSTWRRFLQDDGTLPVRFGGFAPSGVKLSGAGFLRRFPLGLAVEASGEWFALVGNDFAGNPVRLPQSDLRLSAALATRWTHRSGFSAEGQLGYAAGRLPRVGVSNTGISGGGLDHHGPLIAARLGYEPGGVIGLALRGLATPFAFGPGDVRLWNYVAGLALAAGNLQLLGLRFAGFVEYEFSTTRAAGAFFTLGLSSHRVGLGLQAVVPAPRLASARPPALAEPGPPAEVPKPQLSAVKPTGPGALRGVIRLTNPPGPGAGMNLQVGSAAVISGGDGTFFVAGVGPGPVPVTVVAPGFERVEEIVMVPPEGEARLELVLKRVRGPATPATLRGLVRSAEGAPIQAQVRIPEVSIDAKAGIDGRFLFSLPGGKYTVIIDARGYESQTKVVELADGDQAIFHCDLQPRTR